MFRVKFSDKKKAAVKTALRVSETEDYQIVLCETPADIEADKINLCFAYEQLDTVSELIHFQKGVMNAKVACTSARGEEMVPLMAIDYIESFGSEITAAVGKRTLQINSKLYKLEAEWREFGFIRISKSLIVNVGKIAAIKRGFNGKLLLVLENEQSLEVNRSFVKEFKSYMEGRQS